VAKRSARGGQVSKNKKEKPHRLLSTSTGKAGREINKKSRNSSQKVGKKEQEDTGDTCMGEKKKPEGRVFERE